MYEFSELLEGQENDYLHEPLFFPLAITPEQCAEWIKHLTGPEFNIVKGDLQLSAEEEAELGDEDRGSVDPEIRIVEKREFYVEDLYEDEDVSDVVSDIFAELEALFMGANEYFKFDIHGINESVNLLHYKHFEEGAGHYVGHTDFGEGSLSTRKLTCIIQLTQEEDYEGCDLILTDYEVPSPKEQCTAIVFPSYMHHMVTPILKGERYCINAWCAGPPFR